MKCTVGPCVSTCYAYKPGGLYQWLDTSKMWELLWWLHSLKEVGYWKILFLNEVPGVLFFCTLVSFYSSKTVSSFALCVLRKLQQIWTSKSSHIFYFFVDISSQDQISSHWTSLSLDKSSQLFNGNKEGTKSGDGRWEKDSIQPPHIFSAVMPGKALATDPSADHWCLPQTIRMFYKPGRVLFWPWYMPFPHSLSPWEPHVKLPAKLCKSWCCFASLARSQYEKIILLQPVSSLVQRGYLFV